MPVYEYVCTTCSHKFDKIQPMGSTAAECPHCEQPARKAISLFTATATSENGLPTPVAGIGGGGCCGGGCGCGP